MLNSYLDTGVAPLVGELSKGAIEAVRLFKQHILLTAGGWNKEAILLCNFLATCIRKPYVKMNWAMVLTGAEGAGKSFFGEFLKKALGEANVNEVSGNTIAGGAKTGFNSWAEGHLACVIEEVKWQGESVFDVMNNLKAAITNPTISCHRKGKDPYLAPNYTNYLLLSNHDDALRLSEGDRRYCVIRSEFPLSEIKAEKPDYFDKLFGCLSGGHVNAIIKMLLDVPNHEEFNPKGQAPLTDEKEILLRSIDDGHEYLIREIIDEEMKLYLKEGDSKRDLKRISLTRVVKKVIRADGGDYRADCKRMTCQAMAALRKLGFVHINRIRVNGFGESVWGERKSKHASGLHYDQTTQSFVKLLRKIVDAT